MFCFAGLVLFDLFTNVVIDCRLWLLILVLVGVCCLLVAAFWKGLVCGLLLGCFDWLCCGCLILFVCWWGFGYFACLCTFNFALIMLLRILFCAYGLVFSCLVGRMIELGFSWWCLFIWVVWFGLRLVELKVCFSWLIVVGCCFSVCWLVIGWLIYYCVLVFVFACICCVYFV